MLVMVIRVVTMLLLYSEERCGVELIRQRDPVDELAKVALWMCFNANIDSWTMRCVCLWIVEDECCYRWDFCA